MSINISEYCSQQLSPLRLKHVLGVVETATALAIQHQTETEPIINACWLHDIARDWSEELLLEKARQWRLSVSSMEQEFPVLLHGKIAAMIALQNLGVDDPAVLEAVAYHTTGKSGMGVVGQIVYLADALEPGRNLSQLKEILDVSMRNLNEGLNLLVVSTKEYYVNKGYPLHPDFVEFSNSLILS